LRTVFQLRQVPVTPSDFSIFASGSFEGPWPEAFGIGGRERGRDGVAAEKVDDELRRFEAGERVVVDDPGEVGRGAEDGRGADAEFVRDGGFEVYRRDSATKDDIAALDVGADVAQTERGAEPAEIFHAHLARAG